MEKEIWKDIKGYEGIYLVSNKGSIMSINYNGTKGKNVILKKHLIGKYFQVTLYKKSTKKICLIHRIVATAFIENKNKYDNVLHKDDNGLNNNVENLEWGNQSKNIKDAYSRGRIKLPIPKKVVCKYDIKGILIDVYESTRDAEIKTGISHKNIGKVALGKRKTAGGYTWKYQK